VALTDQTRLATPTVSSYKYIKRQLQNSCCEKKERKEKKEVENKRARRKGANLLMSITLGE